MRPIRSANTLVAVAVLMLPSLSDLLWEIQLPAPLGANSARPRNELRRGTAKPACLESGLPCTVLGVAAPSVELSMIVKDGAGSLGRCLASVAGLVDRIALGDTGSTDDSLSIARSFGAEIVAVPWQNDFAHARNLVLEHSRCDWILVLDADEMLDATVQTLLPETIAREDVLAYELQRWNYVHTTNSWSGDEGALANPRHAEHELQATGQIRVALQGLTMRCSSAQAYVSVTAPTAVGANPALRRTGQRGRCLRLRVAARRFPAHRGSADRTGDGDRAGRCLPRDAWPSAVDKVG